MSIYTIIGTSNGIYAQLSNSYDVNDIIYFKAKQIEVNDNYILITKENNEVIKINDTDFLSPSGTAFEIAEAVQLMFKVGTGNINVTNPFSLEATQLLVKALLTTISTKDFATQTTLASILTKIIASPATEAKQDTGITKLTDIYNLWSDSPRFDAFSRLRVSDPTTLFSVQQQYDNSPIQIENYISGTGVASAHDTNNRMTLLSCTAGIGVCGVQSYQYIPYQPLKSQEIAMTGVLGAGVENSIVDFGYGDDDNGIFLRQNGILGLQIVRKTKTSGTVVEEIINKANWNINPSITIDETKSIIFVIDLQFLGMGRVRCYFDFEGILKPVHQFDNANKMTVPYMQTATLPIRMQITANSTIATKSCYFKCAAVNSEGGFIEDYGYSFASPIGTVTAASGAFTHILSLRPKTTFNGKTNRSQLILMDFDITVTGNSPIDWKIVYGASFSVAPTWADINASSSMQYATGGTLSGEGNAIHSGFCPASNNSKNSVSQSLSLRTPITLDKAGLQRANGTISILVSGIGGTSATRCIMNFKEIR